MVSGIPLELERQTQHDSGSFQTLGVAAFDDTFAAVWGKRKVLPRR